MSLPTQSFGDEHEAFAASRVSQYVYVPTRDHLFQTLDLHADTLEGDVKLPLVLLGYEVEVAFDSSILLSLSRSFYTNKSRTYKHEFRQCGSGKSALLANWLAKRREHRHRDEFLFQHFVGCTTPSLQLAHTLFRLETALKDFFQLREMKVPDTEEELRWSLNRFLAAAAKKHFPARIVIIIDGINQLKAEGVPDGALHWLPTEMPPCVRFLVSTVEFERQVHTRGGVTDTTDIPQHRTFVELARRQCALLRIEPLSVPTRHSVILSFVALSSSSNNTIELSDSQQFKIVTAPATSQPMYLRSLLQALRATSSLTTIPMDQLLETFLSCNTAHELIEKQLNICCEEISGSSASGTGNADVLGKIFSMVYITRNGLTEAEIWGMVRMVSKYHPDDVMAAKLFSILEAFTMVVNNMHSFSHEIYREVVYRNYICSQDALIRWHYLMAKYFGQLPPCDRKLEALPFHLEMAGSWSKVKNCLIDIEMFQLWWTPKFKTDFIKFWASLTRQRTSTEKKEDQVGKKGGHKKGLGDTGMDGNESSIASRPTYDIVEEYVKSLDEYRLLKHPTDEAVSDIILGIADFLLEFAILGHEALADVPNLIHPQVPVEDLRALGVPHLAVDEEGRSSLLYPSIFPLLSNADDGIGAADAPPRAINDVPVHVTTYFFHRWMWIHFPYVALGNCNQRYKEGITKMQESSTAFDHQQPSKVKKRSNGFEGDGKDQKSLGSKESAWASESFKLPEIKFARKATKTVRRIMKGEGDENSQDKLTIRLEALQDDVRGHKEEFDFVVNMKSTLQRREDDLIRSLDDLRRTAESSSHFDTALNVAVKRERDVAVKTDAMRVLHKNLDNLLTLCHRHPANIPALITEIEWKLEQDNFLVTAIRDRLWEHMLEKQTYIDTFKHLKALIKEGAETHNKLLEYRYGVKKTLAHQSVEDQRKLLALQNGTLLPAKTRKVEHPRGTQNLEIGNQDTASSQVSTSVSPSLHLAKMEMTWEETWALVSSRTGIIEPDIFFQRLNNGGVLEEQIFALKKASESRLECLKKEAVAVEAEMEDVRYAASFAAGPSNKDKIKELGDKQQNLRHVKEKSEGAQELVQKIEGGLAHIGELLGVEKREEDQTSSVGDLLRDIETALDTVLDEREKQLQQQGQQQGQGSVSMGNSQILPHQGEQVLSPFSRLHTPSHSKNIAHLEMGYDSGKAFAKPRGMKPRVHSREGSPSGMYPGKSRTTSPRDSDEDEQDDPMDRSILKASSMKNIKAAEKKAAKEFKNKLDLLNATK